MSRKINDLIITDKQGRVLISLFLMIKTTKVNFF